MVEEDSLTDDILLQSFCTEEHRNMAQLFESSMLRGGFSLNKWYFSGDNKTLQLGFSTPLASEEETSEDGHLLGIIWNCFSDTFQIAQSFNLRSKTRGRKNNLFEMKNITQARTLFGLYKITKKYFCVL